MKTPTLEEMNRPRTEAEADAAILRISAGTVRRCIPAQVDDDDVTLGAVVEEWKRYRAGEGARARNGDPCSNCGSTNTLAVLAGARLDCRACGVDAPLNVDSLRDELDTARAKLARVAQALEATDG